MVLRPTLKLVTTQTSVTGEENGGKQLPPIELLSQLKKHLHSACNAKEQRTQFFWTMGTVVPMFV